MLSAGLADLKGMHIRIRVGGGVLGSQLSKVRDVSVRIDAFRGVGVCMSMGWGWVHNLPWPWPGALMWIRLGPYEPREQRCWPGLIRF